MYIGGKFFVLKNPFTELVLNILMGFSCFIFETVNFFSLSFYFKGKAKND